MSTDDIIRMAREAGFNAVLESMTGPLVFEAEPQHLERFAALAAEKEREACAQVCERAIASIFEYSPQDIQETGRNVCTNLAAAIRARKDMS